MQQITVFIDLKDQLNMFRTKNLSIISARLKITACGMVSCWVGGQEGGSVVLCAWCEGRITAHCGCIFTAR
jgi:hypothetical protein